MTETMLAAIAAALVLIYTAVISPILLHMQRHISELQEQVRGLIVQVKECGQHREDDMLWRARWEPTITDIENVHEEITEAKRKTAAVQDQVDNTEE